MEPNWALARKRHLEQRARIVQTIRAFFVDGGYLEVETPHRCPATPRRRTSTRWRPSGRFLHTSPELCMKRLLAAGYPRLFQLCRCWRQEERGARHLPEFTMLEWYRAGARLPGPDGRVRGAGERPGARRAPLWQGQTIDLTPPWERLTVAEAFARHARCRPRRGPGRRTVSTRSIAFEVEPHLGAARPTFLIEYPAEPAPPWPAQSRAIRLSPSASSSTSPGWSWPTPSPS